MKIVLSKTTMVIKKEKTAKFEVIDGLTIAGNSATTQKITSSDNYYKLLFVETEAGVKYKITLTPTEGSPAYKYGNTNSKEVGTLVDNYYSNGGISGSTTLTITGNDFKYFVVSLYHATVSVEIVE